MNEGNNLNQNRSFSTKIVDALKDITEFDFLSVEFFWKNKSTILIVVGMIFLMINNRYVCQDQTREIVRLKERLLDAKYESVTRSSELIGIGRPSKVKEMIKKLGVDIEESDKPAYSFN